MDYRARMYDPGLGRFVQPDTIISEPINPGTLNRFSYVQNSPTRHVDPTGHYIEEYDFDDPFFWDSRELDQSWSYLLPPEVAEEYYGVRTALRVSLKTLVGEFSGFGTSEPWLSHLTTGPDYISVTVVIPLPFLLVIGPAVSIARDRYNNWYWSPGIGISFTPTIDIGFGWRTTGLNNIPTEEQLENTMVHGWSLNLSAGDILGAGYTNWNPAIENDDFSGWENQAIEAELTTPGFSAALLYGFWIYDDGDATPWFWQDWGTSQ